MTGALSQLWGLINGLSLFVHLPLVGILIPDHTLAVLNQLIEIAQFDFFENEDVYGWLIPFTPEQDDLLEKWHYFVETGYESNYAFINMGTNVIIITILFFFMLLLVCFLPCKKQAGRVGRYHRKCSGIIYWNFWLRMLIQGCLEIGIAAMMHIYERNELLHKLEDYGSYLFFNDLLSFVLVALFAILPFFVIGFYCKKFDRLGEEKFTETYGSAYDGLRTNSRWILFFPVFFLVRRYIFICMAFEMSDYPALFLFVLIFMTMIAAIYLQQYSPFEQSLLLRLEYFNEMTSMTLLYTSLCLTMFVPDEGTRDHVGTFFIVVMTVNCIVHLFYMVRSTVIECKKKSRKKKHEKAIADAAKNAHDKP